MTPPVPSAGSSATHTATYIGLSIWLFGSMASSGPQANSFHCGLFAPQRFSVSVSACSWPVAVFAPQQSVIVPPPGR